MIMPMKPLTPFGTGLASKIYWCAYVQPNITHRIANAVYGKYAKNSVGERKKGGHSDPSRITQVIRNLKDNGFLKRDEDNKYHVDIVKLVSALQEILKKEKSSLDVFSAHILMTVVDSPITRMNFAITQPLTRLSKYPDKEMSFMTSFTATISLSSLGALNHIKKNPKEKNWLRNKVREHNDKISETNSNSRLITQEQYFDKYVRSLEEILRSGDKGNKLLAYVEKEITFTNEFNQNLVALLWNVMLIRIPESVLIKMIKLNKNVTTAYEQFTVGGRLHYMPRKEAVDHLISLYKLHGSDKDEFIDSVTGKPI